MDNNINMESKVLEEHEQNEQGARIESFEEKVKKELQDKAEALKNELREDLIRTHSVEKERKADTLPKRPQVKNPFNTLTPKVTQLIYWENPTHSGAILAIGLSFLIYTAYFSLFNTFFALATILLGANWVYVMGRKQFQALINQKPVNPHGHLLAEKPWYIERKEAEKYLDTVMDAINFVLLEAQKIVLVDDPMRTMRYVISSYILWTLGCWISFRTLIGMGLVLGFVTPIAYQRNKTLVDEKLDQLNKFLHSHLDRGLDVAQHHMGGLYEKAKSFVENKGLVSGDKDATQNTKKEE